MAASRPARLGVLISGGGRTLANLVERCRRGDLPADIALVVASRENDGAALARGLGLATRVVPRDLRADELEAFVREHCLDLIVLAGYLRRLPVPASLEGRILNIHPALLPGDGTAGRFGGRGMHGLAVHRAVIDAGQRESGCTVHLVTADYDAGPVVLTRRCAVLDGDTPEGLAARVFELELEAYPAAIAEVIARIAAGRHP